MLGKQHGFEVAINSSIPFIRFEIYKAEVIINAYDDMEYFKDVFNEDKEYYLGYRDALYEAKYLQHKYILHPGNWNVRVVDIRGLDNPCEIEGFQGYLHGVGKYKVELYNNSIPDSSFDARYRYIYIL